MLICRQRFGWSMKNCLEATTVKGNRHFELKRWKSLKICCIICDLSISYMRPVEDEEVKTMKKCLIQRWYAKSAMILGNIDQFYIEATQNYQYHVWICSFDIRKAYYLSMKSYSVNEMDSIWRVCAFSSVRLWRVAKNWDTYILPVKKGLLLQPSVQPLQPKVPLLEPLFRTGFPAPPRKSTN